MGNTHVDMCRNITLDPRVVINKPGTSNITPRFEYGVINNILHVWESVLKLVRHQQPGESSTNRKDLDSFWGVRKLGAQLERVAGYAIFH